MKAKIEFIAVCIFMLLPSCKFHRGSKDFAESIGQCERIIYYMGEYEKTSSRSPSAVELRDFIEKDESRSGYRVIRGWTFYEAGATYIATKRNVQNQQGSHADIFIHPNRKYTIVASNSLSTK